MTTDSTDPASSPPQKAPNGGDVTPTAAATPMPFEGLRAPEPVSAAPPTAARWLAFASILLGGLLGGLIGYGTADVMGASSMVTALGGVAGALLCAVGVGVVAALTLRAMNEWRAVTHPEADGDRTGTQVRRQRPTIKADNPTEEPT